MVPAPRPTVLVADVDLAVLGLATVVRLAAMVVPNTFLTCPPATLSTVANMEMATGPPILAPAAPTKATTPAVTPPALGPCPTNAKVLASLADGLPSTASVTATAT